MIVLPHHRIGRYLTALDAADAPIPLVMRINTRTFTVTVYDRAGGCGVKRRYQRLQLSAEAPPDLVTFFLEHKFDAERPRSLTIKRRRPYRHNRWTTAACTACDGARGRDLPTSRTRKALTFALVTLALIALAALASAMGA